VELKGEVGKQEYRLANKVPVFERLDNSSAGIVAYKTKKAQTRVL